MRYDLIVFDLTALSVRAVEGGTDMVLRELTDLGATLGLVSESSEPVARELLGPALQHFDALEYGDSRLVTSSKVERVMHRLEFMADSVLLVTARTEDIAAVKRLGVSSAYIAPPTGMPLIDEQSAHTIATLSDVVGLAAGRPILRIVR
jgi:phosphoglycolate phosphatase-like HAD superfamily hydrolase